MVYNGSMEQMPPTLMAAAKYFGDEDKAHAFVVNLRWPNGVCCPRCGSVRVQYISTRRIWKCKDCLEKKQFSVKVGTIFEDSPLPLGKWLIAVWMVTNCKNGISSYEVARDLGVTQKSAWFMLQRIRLAMQVGSFDRPLRGEVESDETAIGGLSKFMHKRKRALKITRTGSHDKAIVQGILERNGEIRLRVVPTVSKAHLQSMIREQVEPGSAVYTDRHKGYWGLSDEYVHKMVDHAVEYVNGRVHTNGLENFWSLLKRSIKGTYVAVEPFHLFRYLDEQSFRYNNRKGTDSERFLRVLSGAQGKRLTYNTLTTEVPDTEGCSE